MKKIHNMYLQKLHSFNSCNSFEITSYTLMLLFKILFHVSLWKHNSNLCHIYAFHWRFSANNALCQDLVNT